MSTNLIYLGNDHDVTLTAATAGGSALTAASVSWSVLDSAGEEQATGSMTHAGGGTYVGVIESSDVADLAAGSLYTVVITLEQGGYHGRWSQRRTVADRPFSG